MRSLNIFCFPSRVGEKLRKEIRNLIRTAGVGTAGVSCKKKRRFRKGFNPFVSSKGKDSQRSYSKYGLYLVRHWGLGGFVVVFGAASGVVQ